MTVKPRILILAPFFLPSEQGGGLVRAVDYLVQHLHEDFEFVVATSNHDLRDHTPYPEAARAAARSQAKIDIRYLPAPGRWQTLRALLAEGFDLIYLNSFLSRGFSLTPLLARRLLAGKPAPVLLAPRGELMAGAMQHKRRRKQAYLQLLRATGMLRDVLFHATSLEEARELRALGFTRVGLAPDLPPRHLQQLQALQIGLDTEPLRIVFAARIDPKKNLLAALAVLNAVHASVHLDIIGPIGDATYWAQCQPLLKALPAHVKARYLGAQTHADLQRSMGRYELLLLPTRAENNGYVILEALLAGCVLLISNATPWRGLQALDIGWDVDVDDIDSFAKALDDFARMSPGERLRRRDLARQYGLGRMNAGADIEATRRLLHQACQP